MLFILVRIIIFIGITVSCFFILKSSKIVKRRIAWFSTVILAFCLISFISIFPIENLFVNFKSPEDVFNYAKVGKINDVEYGKKSCIVIYSAQNNTIGHYIITKTQKGYKIPNYFSSKRVSKKFDQNGSFDIYHVSNTEDYYILGIVISNKKNQDIFDINKQPVNILVFDMGNTETKTVIVYSYIENFNNNYYLFINGTKTYCTG